VAIFKNSGTRELDGVYVVARKTTRFVSISRPESLKNSVFDATIFFHEIEHGIQDLTLKSSSKQFVSSTFGFDKIWNKARIIRECEYGAMSAEWEWLNVLPADIKENAIQLLMNEDQLDLRTKKNWKRRLLLSEGLREDYLKQEYLHGRYGAYQSVRVKAAPTSH